MILRDVVFFYYNNIVFWIVCWTFYYLSFSLTVLRHVRTGFGLVDLEYRRAARPRKHIPAMYPILRMPRV
jgi:hypothetical protein